ncbi:methyltransferase domain-containing protein [Apiospora sp. TS-2023a]
MTDRGDTNEAAIDRAPDEGPSSPTTAHNTAHAAFPDWGFASDFDDSGLEGLITENATTQPDHSTTSASELGETLDDDWRSLTSSIAQHYFENGRGSQPYPWPNDELDSAREDEMREVFKELRGGRHFVAPIDERAQKIVDLGCGNGGWASEVAELFPGAEVVAMDISPIQPVFAPPNLTTRLADIETDLDGVCHMPSDLVHLGSVAPYLRRPKELMAKMLTNLRPGGWIEFEDLQTKVFSDDADLPPENGFAYAVYLYNKGQREKFGFDLDTAWNLPQALREIGFVNVRQVMYKAPVGPWPDHPRGKWIGYLLQSVLRQIVEPLALRPLQALGLSQSDISAVVHDFDRDLADTSLHMWMPITITIGQKPPEDSSS